MLIEIPDELAERIKDANEDVVNIGGSTKLAEAWLRKHATLFIELNAAVLDAEQLELEHKEMVSLPAWDYESETTPDPGD